MQYLIGQCKNTRFDYFKKTYIQALVFILCYIQEHISWIPECGHSIFQRKKQYGYKVRKNIKRLRSKRRCRKEENRSLYAFFLFWPLLHRTLFEQFKFWISKNDYFKQYLEIANDSSWKSHQQQSCTTHRDLTFILVIFFIQQSGSIHCSQIHKSLT